MSEVKPKTEKVEIVKVTKGKKKAIKISKIDNTLKQEIFCQEWVDSVGNNTMAALKAFDITDKDLIGQELPKKPDTKDAEEIKIWEEECASLKKREKNAYRTASVIGQEYLRKPNIVK